MNYLTRTTEVEDCAPSTELSDQQRYEQNLVELHAAERAYDSASLAIRIYNSTHKSEWTTFFVDGRAYTRVNALANVSAELRQLELRRTETLTKRNELLAEHGRLKMAVGLCK